MTASQARMLSWTGVVPVLACSLALLQSLSHLVLGVDAAPIATANLLASPSSTQHFSHRLNRRGPPDGLLAQVRLGVPQNTWMQLVQARIAPDCQQITFPVDFDEQKCVTEAEIWFVLPSGQFPAPPPPSSDTTGVLRHGYYHPQMTIQTLVGVNQLPWKSTNWMVWFRGDTTTTDTTIPSLSSLWNIDASETVPLATAWAQVRYKAPAAYRTAPIHGVQYTKRFDYLGRSRMVWQFYLQDPASTQEEQMVLFYDTSNGCVTEVPYKKPQAGATRNQGQQQGGQQGLQQRQPANNSTFIEQEMQKPAPFLPPLRNQTGEAATGAHNTTANGAAAAVANGTSVDGATANVVSNKVTGEATANDLANDLANVVVDDGEAGQNTNTEPSKAAGQQVPAFAKSFFDDIDNITPPHGANNYSSDFEFPSSTDAEDLTAEDLTGDNHDWMTDHDFMWMSSPLSY